MTCDFLNYANSLWQTNEFSDILHPEIKDEILRAVTFRLTG